MIWSHDQDVLTQATAFYAQLEALVGAESWGDLQALLASEQVPAQVALSQEAWEAAQAANRGFQSGAAVLGLLPAIAERTAFFDLRVNDDLTIHIPDRLTDSELQAAMAKVLVPPPVAKSDEILAASGGMFYGREDPGAELYVSEGDHFEAGEDEG